MRIEMYESLIDRLLIGFHASDNGCWVWSKAVDIDGYGVLWSKCERRNLRAHRVSYEAMVGIIPDGLVIDHLCRNRACVRPDHLDPVAPGVNTLRGHGFPGINARKSKCINGHSLDDAYVYDTYRTETRRNGRKRRVCRVCVNNRAKAK